MTWQTMRKLVRTEQLDELRRSNRADGRAIVLCHGCFDIVHPGHVRYLQFARQQGDVLVVSLTGDDAIEKSDGTRPYVPQELRAESIAALEFVDHVVIADGPTAEPIIRTLRPDVYVKGREYEHSAHPGFLAERELVESLDGRIIFSSGEVVFSSSALIESMTADSANPARRLAMCCRRWNIDAASMKQIITSSFVGKRVAIVGDAMLDRYTFCDATDVANEAPVLSLRPLEETAYLGGAAVIAAHLRAMGATPYLFTTIGVDEDSAELLQRINNQRITHTTFKTRKQLPTKQRYIVEQQKLMKIDRCTPQPLDSTTQRRMVAALHEMRNELDAVIFADFGYGTITRTLLADVLPMLRPHVDTIAGDVSGLRLSMMAMNNMDLLTPTERELRSALGDFEQSLPTLASHLMSELRIANLAVTMGRRGSVLFRPREENSDQWFTSRLRSEHLPALVPHAIDPVGAGDAYLAAATLMLSTGASLPHAGYIGSAAAAITVGRMGNEAVTRDDLVSFLTARPELNHRSLADVG